MQIANIIGVPTNTRLTDDEVVALATELFNLQFVWDISDGLSVDLISMITDIAERLLGDRGIDMDVYRKALDEQRHLKTQLRMDLFAGVKAHNQPPKASTPSMPPAKQQSAPPMPESKKPPKNVGDITP